MIKFEDLTSLFRATTPFWGILDLVLLRIIILASKNIAPDVGMHCFNAQIDAQFLSKHLMPRGNFQKLVIFFYF